MVSPEGSPTDVKIIKSSGNDELDSVALDAAKKWRFKPATRDGQPIESRVILHIEFEVQ
jgi:protein TonB